MSIHSFVYPTGSVRPKEFILVHLHRDSKHFQSKIAPDLRQYVFIQIDAVPYFGMFHCTQQGHSILHIAFFTYLFEKSSFWSISSYYKTHIFYMFHASQHASHQINSFSIYQTWYDYYYYWKREEMETIRYISIYYFKN